MGRWTGFPQTYGVGKMYAGSVRDNKFKPEDIISWANYWDRSGPLQWLGWQSKIFSGEKLRISFWIKFVYRVPAPSGNFGIKVYGMVYNDFVKRCKANVWCYVEKTIQCKSSGDGNHVILIFDSIRHTQVVRISMLQVQILKGNIKFMFTTRF